MMFRWWNAEYRFKSLYSIEGSQAKMSTARRFQGARSRRYSVSAMQRNAESGGQGHLQPFRFCLNTGSNTFSIPSCALHELGRVTDS